MERIKVGEKYGRLTVLENHHPKDEVVCQCDCGNIKIARATNVFYGGTRSCGCLPKEGNNLKHGDRRNGKKNRLYMIWKSMRERCSTPSQNRYKNYGGRGIKVCSDWDDFLTFKKWALSNGYNNSLTIDRIDVDGDYCPENCKWSTTKEQANNKTNNHRITINGVTHTMTEWGDISGIKSSTIFARLKRGWTEEDAVFKPLRKHKVVN